MIKKNLKFIILLVIGIVDLFFSTKYYKDFNRNKIIKACIIGKAELDSKKSEEDRLSKDQIRKFCEDQIK